MAVRVTQVPGERLSEFLRESKGPVARVDVSPAPQRWAPLKPDLLQFVRQYRASGGAPPTFSGVPVCLFGSEWSGFPSTARATPARGRCMACRARDACGFAAAVPEELHPISDAPTIARWRAYGAVFGQVTDSDMASACAPLVEEIVSAYPGPVSLEPSVLVADAVEPAVRFVVFPHRAGEGAEAVGPYRDVLACAGRVLSEIGANPCAALLDAVGELSPMPVPLGLEGRDGSWRLKMYLRLEDATPIDKQAALDAIAGFAPGISTVPRDDLQMVGLVMGNAGLHTVKAYVSARPTGDQRPGYPPPMSADHPLIALAGDRALATIDIWGRGAARPNKWDLNLRDHYLAGAAVERLVAAIGSERGAEQLRPLLVQPAYRADVVALGLRDKTVALYMELN